MGAGLELACACDIRICTASSRFAIPSKNLGLVLSYPELKPVYEVAGKAILLEMLLEGRVFTAEEALQKNLVSRVVQDEHIEGAIAETVERISYGAPLTARWQKRFVHVLAEQRAITAEEHDACFDCYDTEDYRTGCAAFLRRDHPVFKGK